MTIKTHKLIQPTQKAARLISDEPRGQTKTKLVQKTMTQSTIQSPVSSINLDEAIYPGKGIDHRRVAIFSETIRDEFDLDPVEVVSRKLKSGNLSILKDTRAAIDGGNP